MAGIYKEYDIRMRGEELEGKKIDRVNESVIRYFQDRGVQDLIIGADMRPSSELIKHDLVGRAISGGINVLLVQNSENRVCSTPLFNYVCSRFPEMYGVVVTASHNPSDYNGLKLNFPGCKPIGYKKGLNVIEEISDTNLKQKVRASVGKLSTVYPLRDFVKETCKSIGLHKGEYAGLKIALDCSNSMGFVDGKAFFDFLGANVTYINDWLDGSFPAHESDPTKSSNLRMLESRVRCGDFFCGLMFDGDADRIVIVDKNGRTLPASNIASLIVPKIATKEGFATVYTTTLGRAFKYETEKYNGKSFRVKVGRNAVIDKGIELLRKNKTVFGAEGSYHFMSQDKRGRFYENTLFVAGSVIDHCLKNGTSLSDASKKFEEYNSIEERSYKISVPEREELFEQLKKIGNDLIKGNLETDDGILVEDNQKGEWFSVRASNTEPVIKLNVETKSKNRSLEIADCLEKRIFSLGGVKK